MIKEATTNVLGNAPSNENNWVSSCFVSYFKPPTNHSKINFTFSPLLLFTLLMPNSISLCTIFLLSKIPPDILYHTPLSFFPIGFLFPSAGYFSKFSFFSSYLPPFFHNNLFSLHNIQNGLRIFSLHVSFSHCTLRKCPPPPTGKVPLSDDQS